MAFVSVVRSLGVLLHYSFPEFVLSFRKVYSKQITVKQTDELFEKNYVLEL